MAGSTFGGTIRVSTVDDVQMYFGPFNCPTGGYTVNAGMTIDALATPMGVQPQSLAWMQVVLTQTGRGRFHDVSGAALASPWADTPPGGYQVSNVCDDSYLTRQNFDNEPWYGSNTLGQLSLYDWPRNGCSVSQPCTMNFETWLVGVTAAQGGAYDIVPLVGFTWGFTYSNTGDGLDPGSIPGDHSSEYAGVTHLSLAPGTAPSQAFRDGYAAWFDVRFLENTDANASSLVPVPGSLLVLAGAALIRRRPQRPGTVASC